MKDSYRHKGMRKRMVEKLRSLGISDEAVLKAMLSVPRHFFMDKAFEEQAYENRAFSIGQGQTISQPYTVARMTELLRVKKRDRVLEIGTGSGYQAAILAELGARVFTIERQQPLYKSSSLLLEKLYQGRIRTYFRDGNNGLPEFAPYDSIIVTAAAATIPEQLKQQLAVGARLILPLEIAESDSQELMIVTRTSEREYRHQAEGKYRFVPLLEGTKE